MQLAQNPATNSNFQHIDVRHHFLRELAHKRDISVTHNPFEYQRADIMTKALVWDIFVAHRNFLMNLSD